MATKQELALHALENIRGDRSFLTRISMTGRVLVKGDLHEEVQGPADPRQADVAYELSWIGRTALRLPGRGRVGTGSPAMSSVDRLKRTLEINKQKGTPEVTIFDRHGHIVPK